MPGSPPTNIVRFLRAGTTLSSGYVPIIPQNIFRHPENDWNALNPWVLLITSGEGDQNLLDKERLLEVLYMDSESSVFF